MIKLLLFITMFYPQSDTVIKDKRPRPNKLINATSPYLLQHAYNPVNWYEWGEEALEKAKKEDKPILVSIGYSACHWCHVMAHESFENEDIAAIMNEFFVNIKVDREERPDVDKVYMDAVQAMGINGGWPLNVFITPDQKPFFGGTYFPPQTWVRVLRKVAEAYSKEKTKINQSATALAAQLAKNELDLIPQNKPAGLDQQDVEKMYAALAQQFDNKWGGMLRTPKFVMPSQWLFLLRYYYSSKKANALNMVMLTLNRMAMGGLYDQVGGGFSRYSVDEKWLAPHFEKMLYDNAQLLSLYSEAYAVTGNDMYKRIVYETVNWLEQEMTGAEGGFYAAIDADSEGEEGKFYVWKKTEFDSVMRNQPDWMADYYAVSEKGNWEHGNNILFIKSADEDFAKRKKITASRLASSLRQAKIMLHNAREKRIKPGLDDKILAGWNAMMIDGLLNAYSVFDEPRFLALARQNMLFIEKRMMDSQKLYRSFKGKRSLVEGFLEDYAFLIRAYIALYQATFEESWLDKAQRWTTYTQAHFFDEKEGFFFFSGKSAEQLIAAKKEIFDNVIPSSNSVMARNLYHLGILLDEEKYKEEALKMVVRLDEVIRSNPSFMAHWAILYAEMSNGMAEIVMVGDEFKKVARELRKQYIPFALLMGTSAESSLPLVRGKTNRTDKKATIYVCFNKTCKRPVHTVKDALEQLNNR